MFLIQAALQTSSHLLFNWPFLGSNTKEVSIMMRKRRNSRVSHRTGAITILAAVLMVVVLAVVVFAVDLGYIRLVQAELQNSADAGALAAAYALPAPSSHDAVAAAQDFASQNHSRGGDPTLLVADADVEPGTWDVKTHVFTPVADPADANTVRVTVHRCQASGNPAKLFFARVLGHDSVDVAAVAVATRLTRWNIIAANKLQIGSGSVVSGVSAYGRRRVELGSGVSVVDGARIGSLPGSVVQYSNAQGLPENLVRADVQPELANQVANLINQIEAGQNLPDQITQVKKLAKWPPAKVESNTAYVVNGSVSIKSGSTLTLHNNIIAARGTISVGEESRLLNDGAAGDINTALYTTGDVQIGRNAEVRGVDMVAGHDIQIGEELVALEIGIMEAVHDIQFGQGPTLSGLYSIGADVRLVQ